MGASHCDSVGRRDPSGTGKWSLDNISVTQRAPTRCTGLQLIHIPEGGEMEEVKGRQRENDRKKQGGKRKEKKEETCGVI